MGFERKTILLSFVTNRLDGTHLIPFEALELESEEMRISLLQGISSRLGGQVDRSK